MLRIAVLFLSAGAMLQANGIIVPTPFPPHPVPVAPPRRPLSAAAERVRLEVRIEDQAAVTAVEEAFVNPNPHPLEGTFILPVPPDARISRFSFFINGKEVKGEILPRDAARRYYREIVARLLDPALLEYMDKGLIRVTLFPIPPHGKAKMRFSYTQILGSEGGQLTYYYPFGTNKFSSRALKEAVVDVRIKSSLPLRAIYSPRYEVDVVRKGEHEARVSFEKRNFTPKEDFLLYVGRSEGDFGLTSIAYRAGKEDGYFLLIVSPKQEFGPGRFEAKDVVFVLDVSGSMAGEKLEQAKKALRFCVQSLGERDRFNLIAFSTRARTFMPGPVPAAEENRKKALEFISDLKALGGTNIDEALTEALREGKEVRDRPFMVVFLTDGQPTVGEMNWRRIVDNVSRNRVQGLRLFVFGVGNDVNTILLDRLAEENHGSRHYVRPNENIEIKVSTFYQEIARPVLSDVSISFGFGGVYDVYPPRITDIFYGSQVILAGRYRESGKGSFEISGKCGGKEYGYRFPLEFPTRAAEASYLPRLWAARKIGYLLDEMRLHGEKKELVEEVKVLARRFGIVTPYTSYFVHEDSPIVRLGGAAPRAYGRRTGRSRGPRGAANGMVVRGGTSSPSSGAVEESLAFDRLRKAASTSGLAAEAEKAGGAGGTGGGSVRYVESKTFYLRGGVWEDSEYKKGMEEKKVVYLSEEYFELLREKPDLASYFALGPKVVVCLEGTAYRVIGRSPEKQP